MKLMHDGIEHETDDAIMFDFGEVSIWIPKSVITDHDDSTLEVLAWFAEKAELEGYMI